MTEATQDIEDIGFDRPCTKPLGATISCYYGHLFIYSGVAYDEWAKKDDSTSELIGDFYKALKPVAKELKIVFNLLEFPSEKENTLDLLYFREGEDAMKIRGIGPQDFEKVGQYLKEDISDGLHLEIVSPNYIFVCAHKSRDARCGYCGPILADHFQQKLIEMNLQHQWTVAKVSHVGGHVYAGNIIVYPDGVWYGYIRPDDVARVIEEHLENGEILVDKLRGKIGLTREEQFEFCGIELEEEEEA